MATKSADLKTDSWKNVNSGACAVFKTDINQVKVYTGSSAPDDSSPFIYWSGDSFQYDGTDDVYMKSCVEAMTVVIIT